MRTATQVYERADMTEINSAYFDTSERALAIKQRLCVLGATRRKRSKLVNLERKLKNEI